MADATQQQRLVLPVGSQSAVEGETADLEEVLQAVDSSGEIIGYSTDNGATWVWPSGGNPASDTQVWMPLTTVVGGEPELVWDDDDSLIPTLVPI